MGFIQDVYSEGSAGTGCGRSPLCIQSTDFLGVDIVRGAENVAFVSVVLKRAVASSASRDYPFHVLY